MKEKILYVCEVCGKTSTRKSDIDSCEKKHHQLSKLTVGEMNEWKMLKDEFKQSFKRVCHSETDEELEKSFEEHDKVYERLYAFEERHGID